MKVLHIKAGRPLSGIGSFILNMSNNLPNDINFDYLLNGHDNNQEFDNKVNNPKSNIFIAPELNNIFEYIKYLKYFYKAYADKYDIVHIHSPNVALFNYYYAKKNGIKHIILHSHNAAYSDKFISSIRNYVLIFPLKFLKLTYLSCGEKAAQFLFGKKMCKAKIVYNGVDFEKFVYSKIFREEIRTELGLSDMLVVGHIGNFTKQKNYEFIIKLSEELSKSEKIFKMLLIGDGPEKSSVLSKINELGLNEYFILTGKVDNVAEYINAFDLMILPSKFEGFPYVCVEVQAMGVPMVLSSNIDNSVKINNNVEFLDLDINKWSKFIIQNRFENIEVNMDNISIFNAKYQADKLYKIYGEILEK